ncbi:ATP-binding protein [Streptomyces sp. NPDC058579]|uniref:ATP-binding protein n=1 Tax=Streptomyces sp. NPDC058579 TaxID=3346548 RepID=UPI0036611DA0
MTEPFPEVPSGAPPKSLLAYRMEELEDRLRQLYLARSSDPSSAAPGPAVLHEAPDLADCDPGDPLAGLCRAFGLDAVEADLLVAALLPEVNADCAGAYRMLGPLPRPSAATALELAGLSLTEAVARGLLHDGSALLSGGLVVFENPQDPFAERCLRVPDLVVRHLLADTDAPTPLGDRRLRGVPPIPCAPDTRDDTALAALTAQLRTDAVGALYLRESVTGAALPTACSALRAVGRTPLLLDPFDLEHTETELLNSIRLEGQLAHGGIVIPAYLDEGDPALPVLSRLVSGLARGPLPVVLYGSEVWQEKVWRTVPRATFDVRGAARARPLPTAAGAVIDIARRDAVVRGEALPVETARHLAHAQAARSLGQLARPVTPQVALEDLVLSDWVREQLDMLVFRIERREEVLGTHGLRRGGGRGWGATALFTGESGTGKTMAAEAVAGRLGLDLYIVSLPSVVSKYIGETEKNLERIFYAAETLECVVLFDEADTLFSKRGAVKDSNDRHGNLQIGYMLQRLEQFNGLAILTTNLRANVDSAFTRRFDEIVEFASPTADVRAELWRRYLAESPDAASDVGDVAQDYALAGGNIRAAVETAVFRASALGRPVASDDVLRGVETEYRKLGRLFQPPTAPE